MTSCQALMALNTTHIQQTKAVIEAQLAQRQRREAQMRKEIEEKDFAGKIDIVAQNVKTTDFEDPVFKPYVIKNINGVPVAIVGQAFPYTPIANHVPPNKPAREYKFTLDPFQQVSIHAIQRNESVLVSAHTSAGKTVVAEYAIAQCLQHKQRVIYTSPIKVISVFLHNLHF